MSLNIWMMLGGLASPGFAQTPSEALPQPTAVALERDKAAKALLQANANVGLALMHEPKLCAAFYNSGWSTDRMKAIQQATAQVAALGTAGQVALKALDADPSANRTLTPALWSDCVTTWLASGATQSQLKAVSDEDQNSPHYCSGMVSLLQHMKTMKGESGEAMRSGFATTLTNAIR